MNDSHCPSTLELAQFIDADDTPERLARAEEHVGRCASCAAQVTELRQLVSDLGAPLPAAPLDVKEHTAGVMARLDQRPVRERARWLPWLGGVAAAAALVVFVSRHDAAPNGEFTARGAAGPASLSRDVGIQLYAQKHALEPLVAGQTVRAGTALTAGLRNLAAEPAYVLLFAVDAEHVVHWIAPAFTVPGSDPESARILPGESERLLPTAAVFDDLAPGPLRVVALVTRTPERVSQIESLEPGELAAEQLLRRFPGSELRQFLFTVSP